MLLVWFVGLTMNSLKKSKNRIEEMYSDDDQETNNVAIICYVEKVTTDLKEIFT